MADSVVSAIPRSGSLSGESEGGASSIAREENRWHSPALDREMDLLVFGHAGARLLAFPTSEGRYYDWERFGLVDAIANHLRNGAIQLFCADSIDSDSWYARDRTASERAQRHAQYDQYLRDEVVPFSEQRNPGSPLMISGASFGAYHAVTFALRYPHLVTRAIGMSGLYDISRFVRGYASDDVDSYNPVAIVANENNPGRLERLRQIDIVLAVGDEPLRESNRRLSALLTDKGIPHTLNISDDWVHDWSSWAEMLRLYLVDDD
ncbi:MAG: esterase family protein [Vicinamibacterales bacterium]